MREHILVYPLIATAVTLAGILYCRVVAGLLADWWTDPGLSQGMLIPPLAVYVAWIRRSRTMCLPSLPDNRGILLVGFSSMLFIVGKLGAEFFLMRLSLVAFIAGIVWMFWGYQRLRTLALPFLLLTTMIPLPKVVYSSISTPLQLFASDTAATIIRALGVTVYRDGNIIYLAAIRLGIEEACSGLNSLTSLMVAAALLSVSLCRTLSARLALLALAVPIALLVNVTRITGTAVLADYHRELALGFYHTFSGWMVFVLGFLALYAIGRTLHVCFD